MLATSLPRMYNVITMKASIVAIGNSRGIRIPRPLLEESGLGSDVEITAKKGKITITARPTAKQILINEEYLLSLKAFDDWNDPEEDAAWASLQ